MTVSRWSQVLGIAGLLASPLAAYAAGEPVVIGDIDDMSGVYADVEGAGGVADGSASELYAFAVESSARVAVAEDAEIPLACRSASSWSRAGQVSSTVSPSLSLH